jgi:hypothetical protein
MNPDKFSSILRLLDDPDEKIYRSIWAELVHEGAGIIPQLETAWELSNEPIVQQRIEDITHHIQTSFCTDNIKKWKESSQHNLSEAAYIISKFQYPLLSWEKFSKQISAIAEDIKGELNKNLTPLEQIKAVNHILYRIRVFTRPQSGSQTVFWYFLSNVLEKKIGNPYSLCFLYAIVAQEAGLPLQAVVLPENMALAYTPGKHAKPKPNGVSFYINPANRGAVFGRFEIIDFLKRSNLPILDNFFEPLSNIDFLCSYLDALSLHYQSIGQATKADDIGAIAGILRAK